MNICYDSGEETGFGGGTLCVADASCHTFTETAKQLLASLVGSGLWNQLAGNCNIGLHPDSVIPLE